MSKDSVKMLVRASKATSLLGTMVRNMILHEDSDEYPVPFNVTCYDNGDVEVEWTDVEDLSSTVAYAMLHDIAETLDAEDYCMTVVYGTVFRSTITTGNYFHKKEE